MHGFSHPVSNTTNEATRFPLFLQRVASTSLSEVAYHETWSNLALRHNRYAQKIRLVSTGHKPERCTMRPSQKPSGPKSDSRHCLQALPCKAFLSFVVQANWQDHIQHRNEASLCLIGAMGSHGVPWGPTNSYRHKLTLV